MSPVRPARPPAIRYRPARRTDVENLADLGARAYRVHSVEKRRDFYTEHPRFGLRDVRVGELDGQIVASLVLYPLKGWVRGQLVPVTGITGERAALPPDLIALVRDLRAVSTRPICVGFGISTPAHVTEVVRYADGAIVGSAIVRLIETLRGDPDLVRKVGDFIASLKAGTLDGAPPGHPPGRGKR